MSLVGSIGLCFAQHLWRILRQEALTLRKVEQLFQIRSKAFAIANVQAFWAAPLLFSMALYLWLLEVTVAFSPSALTVVSQPSTTSQSFNVALVNNVLPNDFNPFLSNTSTAYGLAADIGPGEGGADVVENVSYYFQYL